MGDTEERRPRPESGAPPNAAGHTSTFTSPPATLGDVLLAVEIDLTGAARKLEWAAVAEPDLGRESKIVYLSAARVRARRWAA